MSRYLLAYAGVDYEDIRFDFDEWKQVKESGKYGPGAGLPMYIDEQGRKFTQGTAILQYLSNIHGVTAKNAIEVFENSWYFE